MSIAIIVPVYNVEHYLSKCIHSVLKQTFSDWRLILVDDGSTDNSAKICDRFSEKDNRINVIHQQNKGLVEARRTGVFSSIAQECEYAMFCDSDDLLPKNACQLMYDAIRDNNADLVVGPFKKLYKVFIFDSKWHPSCFQISNSEKYSHEKIIDELFISYFGKTSFPVSVWGKLYKTQYLTNSLRRDIPVKFMGEDLCITIDILSRIESLVVIPETVYYYRVGGGTTRYNPNYMREFISIYHYKKAYAYGLAKEQEYERLMDQELISITKTHFYQCLVRGGFSYEQIEEEIANVAQEETIRNAAENTICCNGSFSEYAKDLLNKDYQRIYETILESVTQNKKRELIKSFLARL